jgi:hypothetical protein
MMVKAYSVAGMMEKLDHFILNQVYILKRLINVCD